MFRLVLLCCSAATCIACYPGAGASAAPHSAETLVMLVSSCDLALPACLSEAILAAGPVAQALTLRAPMFSVGLALLAILAGWSKTCRIKNVVTHPLYLTLVDCSSEPHLLNSCYGGVDPCGDPGRMGLNLSFDKPNLCYPSLPIIRCDFHCCPHALLHPVSATLTRICSPGPS